MLKTSYAQNPAVASHRRVLKVVACTSAEFNTKVRGDVRQVSWYVSNFANLPQWYPGVKKSDRLSKLHQDFPKPGSQFNVMYSAGILSMDVLYEMAEFQVGKRVVYVGSHEHYNTREEFLFMPDPNDRQNTYVCYKTASQLRGWLSCVDPIFEGLLSMKVEASLTNLAKLLHNSTISLSASSSDTEFTENASHFSSSWPQINLSSVFQNLGGTVKQHASKAFNSTTANWARSSNKQAASSMEGDGSSEASSSSDQSSRHTSSHNSSNTWQEAVNSSRLTQVDSRDFLGYYRVLGVEPARPGLFGAHKVKPDAIKQAYRQAAKVWHPDLYVGAEPSQQDTAAQQFIQLQRAYEVLRDPQRRARYDAGVMEPEEEEKQATGV